VGVEPTTASLEGWDSTAELRPLDLSSTRKVMIRFAHLELAIMRCSHRPRAPRKRSRSSSTKFNTEGLTQLTHQTKQLETLEGCIRLAHIASPPGQAKLGMVGRQGFEPWKPMATDLQSAPFGHLGTCPTSPAQEINLTTGPRFASVNKMGKEEQAGPRTAPPILMIKEKVMSSRISLVQETADSIDEVL
jgi:hypothetical protein